MFTYNFKVIVFSSLVYLLILLFGQISITNVYAVTCQGNGYCVDATNKVPKCASGYNISASGAGCTNNNIIEQVCCIPPQQTVAPQPTTNVCDNAKNGAGAYCASALGINKNAVVQCFQDTMTTCPSGQTCKVEAAGVPDQCVPTLQNSPACSSPNKCYSGACPNGYTPGGSGTCTGIHAICCKPATPANPNVGTVSCGNSSSNRCFIDSCPQNFTISGLGPNWTNSNLGSVGTGVCGSTAAYGSRGICCAPQLGVTGTTPTNSACAKLTTNPNCGLDANNSGLFCGGNSSCGMNGDEGTLYKCTKTATGIKTEIAQICSTTNQTCVFQQNANVPDKCGGSSNQHYACSTSGICQPSTTCSGTTGPNMCYTTGNCNNACSSNPNNSGSNNGGNTTTGTISISVSQSSLSSDCTKGCKLNINIKTQLSTDDLISITGTAKQGIMSNITSQSSSVADSFPISSGAQSSTDEFIYYGGCNLKDTITIQASNADNSSSPIYSNKVNILFACSTTTKPPSCSSGKGYCTTLPGQNCAANETTANNGNPAPDCSLITTYDANGKAIGANPAWCCLPSRTSGTKCKAAGGTCSASVCTSSITTPGANDCGMDPAIDSQDVCCEEQGSLCKNAGGTCGYNSCGGNTANVQNANDCPSTKGEPECCIPQKTCNSGAGDKGICPQSSTPNSCLDGYSPEAITNNLTQCGANNPTCCIPDNSTNASVTCTCKANSTYTCVDNNGTQVSTYGNACDPWTACTAGTTYTFSTQNIPGYATTPDFNGNLCTIPLDCECVKDNTGKYTKFHCGGSTPTAPKGTTFDCSQAPYGGQGYTCLNNNTTAINNGFNPCLFPKNGSLSFISTGTSGEVLLAQNVLAAQAIIETDSVNYNPTTKTFSNPNFTIKSLPPGQYQVILHVDGYLNKLLTNNNGNTFSITQGQTTFAISPVALTPGDIAPQPKGDDVIDIQDYNAVIGCFGLSIHSQPTATCLDPQAADINGDGFITQDDLNIVQSEFGMHGDMLTATSSSGTQTFVCITDSSCASNSNAIQMCPLKCAPQ